MSPRGALGHRDPTAALLGLTTIAEPSLCLPASQPSVFMVHFLLSKPVLECQHGALTPTSQIGRPRQARLSGLPRGLARPATLRKGWLCLQIREVSFLRNVTLGLGVAASSQWLTESPRRPRRVSGEPIPAHWEYRMGVGLAVGLQPRRQGVTEAGSPPGRDPAACRPRPRLCRVGRGGTLAAQRAGLSEFVPAQQGGLVFAPRRRGEQRPIELHQEGATAPGSPSPCPAPRGN